MSEGEPFRLTSAERVSKSYRSHAEIDSYGYARGGS